MNRNETFLREILARSRANAKAAKSAKGGNGSKGVKNEAGLDWDAIRQHIRATTERLEKEDELSEEALQQAWERRAAQVAEAAREEEQGEQMEVGIIRLGRELYGLEVQYIFDLRPMEQITRVPRVPEWVAGVVNLRGRILSVVDLLRFLGLPGAEQETADEDRYLLLVQTPEMELAILVDEVLAIEGLPLSQIQEASGAVRGIRAEYVRGIVPRASDNKEQGDAKTLLVLLDLPVLLADKALIIHEEVL